MFCREIYIPRFRSENRWPFVFLYAEIFCTSISIPRQRPLREICRIIRFLIRRNVQCYNHDDCIFFSLIHWATQVSRTGLVLKLLDDCTVVLLPTEPVTLLYFFVLSQINIYFSWRLDFGSLIPNDTFVVRNVYVLVFVLPGHKKN